MKKVKELYKRCIQLGFNVKLTRDLVDDSWSIKVYRTYDYDVEIVFVDVCEQTSKKALKKALNFFDGFRGTIGFQQSSVEIKQEILKGYIGHEAKPRIVD